MKKNIFAAALMLAAFTITANAQETTEAYNMHVFQKSGGTVTIPTTNVDSVSFTKQITTTANVPTGTDLYVWYKDLEKTPTDLSLTLVDGGTYTMSGNIDVTSLSIVGTATTSAPSITLTAADAGFTVKGALTLTNLTIDASQSTGAFIALSTTPDETTKGATGSGDYYNLQCAVTLSNLDITGVSSNLIYDNNKKYCLETLSISNCKIKLTPTATSSVASNAYIYFKSGFINDLSIANSTIWNAGTGDAKYFVQYNNSGRCSRAGYDTNSISYDNCTFYNVAKTGQWGNYSSFSGQKTSYWTMTDNIFVDCSNNTVARRFLGGRQNQATATFANNTYMFEGAFESTSGSVTGYDNSGTAIEEDPGFKDAANGDFTISGAKQIELKTGDPRWLPAATE